MVDVESQRILKLAVSMGEELLRNGGEIYRVQETIERVLSAYGIEDHNVFVVSNGIFATIHEQREDRGSMVRNVPLGSTDLGMITALNQLSREICDHAYTLEEAYEQLERCLKRPKPAMIGKLLAAGMGCSAFCYLFGGRLMECIVAFLLGFLVQLFRQAADVAGVSRFLVNIIGSFLVSTCSYGLAALGMPLMPDQAIVGVIILLVPGMALTTSIRELFNGDYLSGSIHLADALITAICIAVGVGAAVQIFRLMGGLGL